MFVKITIFSTWNLQTSQKYTFLLFKNAVIFSHAVKWLILQKKSSLVKSCEISGPLKTTTSNIWSDPKITQICVHEDVLVLYFLLWILQLYFFIISLIHLFKCIYYLFFHNNISTYIVWSALWLLRIPE